jgi:Leucine-rich repeat (LRR) protein
MTLDLSENLIQILDLNTLSGLPNLKVLRLTHNPVAEIFGVDEAMVSKMPYLEQLDLSYTQLLYIGSGGLQGLVYLQQLDLRGSRVERFSHDMLQNLTALKEVLTSNYRLCCPGILPDTADNLRC